MGFRNGDYLYLYNIHKGKGNYYEAKGLIRGKCCGEWTNTFNGFVRLINCEDKLKDLSDGAKIKLTDCDVERFLEKKDEKYVDYTHFLIFDFDIIRKSKDDKSVQKE